MCQVKSNYCYFHYVRFTFNYGGWFLPCCVADFFRRDISDLCEKSKETNVAWRQHEKSKLYGEVSWHPKTIVFVAIKFWFFAPVLFTTKSYHKVPTFSVFAKKFRLFVLLPIHTTVSFIAFDLLPQNPATQHGRNCVAGFHGEISEANS